MKYSTGSIHVGSGLLDQGALLLADASVCLRADNGDSSSPIQADVYISQPSFIIELVKEGRWKLDTITLSIICLTLINFSKIVGQTMLYANSKLSRPSLFDNIFQDIAASIFPILLLTLYTPNKLNTKSKTSFLRLDWLFSIIMCLISLFAFYFIIFIDHGFTCHPPALINQFSLDTNPINTNV